MLNKLKKMLDDRTRDQQLADALQPLQAHSQALFQRSLAYVQGGNATLVLPELEQSKDPDLVQLMHNPGGFDFWWRSSRTTIQALKKMGLAPDEVAQRRHAYYASAPGAAELIRFGRLLAALGTDIPRAVPGVPLWLTALLNDVVITHPGHRISMESFARGLPQWRAGFVVELLVADGTPADDAARLALLAICQGEDRMFHQAPSHPRELPERDTLLAEHGHLLSIEAAAQLSIEGRALLMERAGAVPEIAAALAPVVATLTFMHAQRTPPIMKDTTGCASQRGPKVGQFFEGLDRVS